MNTRISQGPKHFLQAGIGASAVAALLATGAVASAAPVPSHPGHAQAAQQAARPNSTINVRPGTVNAGARVTITGDAPTKARTGTWVSLMSYAFNSKTKINGVPAVRTQVLANGTYSVTASTPTGLKANTYAIAGSFNGKSFAQVAWLHVRSR